MALDLFVENFRLGSGGRRLSDSARNAPIPRAPPTDRRDWRDLFCRRCVLERQLCVPDLLDFDDERHAAFGIADGEWLTGVLV